MSDTPGKASLQLVVSAVTSEGTLVETIYRPDLAETALVIAEEGSLRIAQQWESPHGTFVPVKASNNLIKHQVVRLPSEPAEYGDTKELISEIEAYTRRYVSLPAYAFGITAAYVLLSWVHDAFNELPYLRFRGDYGTGKSRALIVIGSLCHKAFFASGASTVSPIFHTLDTFRGTLVFDEADFRFTDEKAELVKILNNGSAKGFPVLRTHVSPKKEFNPQAFSIYGPKIVAMRRSYEDRALESRFVTIEMEPGRSAGVPINLPEAQEQESLALRNKLLTYRLRNRLTARIDASLASEALEARMNQILLPLLSVVPDEQVRAVIRGMAADVQAGVVAERAASTEGELLTVLSCLLGEKGDGNVALSDVVSVFIAKFGAEYERPVHSRWVGAILRRMGVALHKSNGVLVITRGQLQRISALCERFGIDPEVSTPDSGR